MCVTYYIFTLGIFIPTGDGIKTLHEDVDVDDDDGSGNEGEGSDGDPDGSGGVDGDGTGNGHGDHDSNVDTPEDELMAPVDDRGNEYTQFARQFRNPILALRNTIIEACYSGSSCKVQHGFIVVDRKTITAGILPAELVCLLMESFEHANCVVDVIISGALEDSAPSTAKSAADLSNMSKSRVIDSALGGAASVKSEHMLDLGQINELDFVIVLAPVHTASGADTPLGLDASISHLRRRLGFIRLHGDGVSDYCDTTDSPPPDTLGALLSNLLPPSGQSITTDVRFEKWPESWKPWGNCPFQFLPFPTLRLKQRDVGVHAGTTLDGTTGVYGDLTCGVESSTNAAVDRMWMQEADSFAELRALHFKMPDVCDGVEADEAERAWDALAHDAAHFAEETVQSITRIPPTHFTQYSTGSQGKLLSIPGLVKWYVTQGNTSAIWLKKDRGGRRRLAICLVVDLTPAQVPTKDFLRGLFALLLAFEQLQVHIQVVTHCFSGVWLVKDGDPWDRLSKLRLLWALASCRDVHFTEPKNDDHRARCHQAEALLLGLQLVVTAQVPQSSPRMIWLLTAGAAPSGAANLQEIHCIADAQNIKLLAISLVMTPLDSLGIPWLMCSANSVHAMVECAFDVEVPLEPPATPDFVLPVAVEPMWVPPEILPQSPSPKGKSLAAGKPKNTYLSPMLEYRCEDDVDSMAKTYSSEGSQTSSGICALPVRTVTFDFMGERPHVCGLYCIGLRDVEGMPESMVECKPVNLEAAEWSNKSEPAAVPDKIVFRFDPEVTVVGFALIATTAGGSPPVNFRVSPDGGQGPTINDLQWGPTRETRLFGISVTDGSPVLPGPCVLGHFICTVLEVRHNRGSMEDLAHLVNMSPAVHLLCPCDGCGSPPIGTRFRCQAGCNFDLCGDCFPRANQLHDSSHQLEEETLDTEALHEFLQDYIST
jgi:hypothetical protein